MKQENKEKCWNLDNAQKRIHNDTMKSIYGCKTYNFIQTRKPTYTPFPDTDTLLIKLQTRDYQTQVINATIAVVVNNPTS